MGKNRVAKFILLIAGIVAMTLGMVFFWTWDVKGEIVEDLVRDDEASAKNRATLRKNGYNIFFEYDPNTYFAYVAGIQSTDGVIYDITIPYQVNIPNEDDPTINDIYFVAGINSNAFENYKYVRNLSLQNSLIFIGSEAFKYCTELTDVSWGTSVTSIGSEAFFGCSKLNLNNVNTPYNLPTSLEQIGSGAFCNCPMIKSFILNNSYFTTTLSEDTSSTKNDTDSSYNVLGTGALYSIEADNTYRLVAVPTGYATSRIKVHSKVYAIDAEAFAYNKNITEVYLPDSVKIIREKAFYQCTALTKVRMSKKADLMGDDIFGGCPLTNKITIYNNNDSNAYAYCKAYGYPMQVLCTVEFYDGGNLLKTQEVEYGTAATAPVVAGKNGFTLTWDTEFKKVITNITVNAVWKQNYKVVFQDKENGWFTESPAHYGEKVTPPVWTKPGFSLAWDSDAYLYVTKDLTINAVWLHSLTDGDVTAGTSSGTYTVGDSFTIGDLTYKVTKKSDSNNRVSVIACRNSSAASIKIPATITAGGTAFKVTNINARVFKNMTSLKKVVIGSNVTKIKEAAFYGCSNLKTIVIYSKKLTADNIAEKSFKNIYSKVKVKVPSGYVAKYKIRLRDGGLPTGAKVMAI